MPRHVVLDCFRKQQFFLGNGSKIHNNLMHMALCTNNQQLVKALFHSNTCLPDSTATTCLVSTFHSNPIHGWAAHAATVEKCAAAACFSSTYMLAQHLHACTAPTCLRSIYMLQQHLDASTASTCFHSIYMLPL